MAIYNEACMALQLSHPFFGTLMHKVPHREDPKQPTLYVTPYEIAYNPEFIAKLTDDEAVFCVAHEIMHMAWGHLPRMEQFIKSGVGPDGKPYNHYKMNKAADYAINFALRKSGVGAVPDPNRVGFEICLDNQYTDEMTPEEIYCLMPDNQGNGNGNGKGSKTDGQQALDGHGSGEAEAAEGKTAPIGPAEVMQAAEAHKAITGNYPAGMERLVGALKRPNESPWAILRQFVKSVFRGNDNSTWRRLQRRLVVRGIGAPGRTAHGTGHIFIVVDTSGSINDEMLQFFGGHMASIMDDARPEMVSIAWTDAAVHRVDVVKNSSDLRAVLNKKVPGGGGTDMTKGVRRGEKEKADIIVVLTDGYTPFCDSEKPLIWAITVPSVKPPEKLRHVYIEG
jgi:predicted metal-dependent peptidase